MLEYFKGGRFRAGSKSLTSLLLGILCVAVYQITQNWWFAYAALLFGIVFVIVMRHKKQDA
jgi:hypothetical protein